MDKPLIVSIVEDDADMRILLERFLTSVGMEVTSFGDTSSLDEAWLATPPDVILLDVNLPGESGFMAAARLRARSMVGLVILTGRTAEEDRLLGLSMGVDHYLSKPVNLRELESVIRNLGRRVGTKPVITEAPVMASNRPGWSLDPSTWLLTAPNGCAVDLSSAEYQVLQSLLEEPGQARSREMLNEVLGKPRLGPDNRSLDVLVSRLRRKVEEAASLSFPLRSARGTGYVFAGEARIDRKTEGGVPH
ncbi:MULTISPECIES: response regulator transcription factor [Sphingobium]|uniref:response regulator transcription factor n=1 Tax=Sphingobium TaxID=165695 RepID=UPI0015EBE635|nr:MULTISPECIES: response regulator transcription factor [Sphingobium]MCW2363831.1 DNA-binding response OmpR family regulator [Sphingobium sp. B10D3B]MCW2402772.1 DNA-binding response OmpR family regulator [Sphingobium sp. B10D7B]MCW2409751.1 DNA-binding response OmpR family regulator [Sphingobium xanthum]